MLNLLARGLSPLTRGKQAASATSGGGLPVHPRSRGENPSRGTRGIRRHGSSPLTRGKPTGPLPADGNTRLIPTHAGKTRALR